MPRRALHPFTRGFWRRQFAPRERELIDAGAEGELLVARARLALTSLILLIPLSQTAQGPNQHENWVGLSAVTLTLLIGIGVLVAVTRGWRPRWLGFATSLFDVTVVSAALASFLLVGPPHLAVNSRTTFEVYFLAIGATCLRYDRRICLITGLVATAQFGAIAWFTAHHWDLNSPAFAPYPYGYFSPIGTVGRLILMIVATLLSMTIVNRNERLRVLSTHDALTSLYNRAYFAERLREELLRASRYGHPLTVAILDLDHFKRVNDELGHVAGDVALQAVAQLLHGEMRRTDTVARYGGEEFAIIFPDTSSADALAMLERVRRAFHTRPIVVPRVTQPIHLTFSGGIASTPDDGTEFDALISCADARLLAAKNAGRDRLIGAGDSAGS